MRFKLAAFLAVVFAAPVLIFVSCSSNSYSPNNPGYVPTNTPAPTATPTPTLTPCGFPGVTCTPTSTPTPQTFTITITSGTLGTYTGYYYTCPSGSNNTSNGVFSLTCHVGDTVNLPAANIHPLYFDNGGSASCVPGVTAGETNANTPYTFPLGSAGTYYIHCGIHAQNCTSITSCSSTNCTGLAGVITVNP